MVHELVLAIDPSLKKLEEVLLWKNRVWTSVIFTACNISMWLLYSFNIRTYCTISCVALMLHLLDAYRNKIKRKMSRMQHRSVQSSIGKYIINAYESSSSLLQRCLKLKKESRVKYFLVMVAIWLTLAVFGMKVKGFYISYAIFWILFFVPAILHYNIPRLLLNKATPILEQLDRSMEYERRSMIDRSELLVDVKLPQTSTEKDDAMEDEYLEPFRFDEEARLKKKQKKDDLSTGSSENVVDEDDDDEIDEEGGFVNDGDSEDDDEFTNLTRATEEELARSKLVKSFNNDVDDDEDDDFLLNEENFKNIGSKIKLKKAKNRPSLLDYYTQTTTTETVDPVTNETTITETTTVFRTGGDNSNSNSNGAAAAAKIVNPSIWLNSMITGAANTMFSQLNQQNEKDIDETFDFLDEELNKNEYEKK